jgi:hypothetical protein
VGDAAASSKRSGKSTGLLAPPSRSLPHPGNPPLPRIMVPISSPTFPGIPGGYWIRIAPSGILGNRKPRAGATKGGRNRQLTARGVRAQLASPMSSRSRRRISPAGRLQLRTCVSRDTLSGRAIDGCGQQSLPALQIAIRREPKEGARDRLYNAEFPRSRAFPEPSCPAAISV